MSLSTGYGAIEQPAGQAGKGVGYVSPAFLPARTASPVRPPKSGLLTAQSPYQSSPIAIPARAQPPSVDTSGVSLCAPTRMHDAEHLCMALALCRFPCGQPEQRGAEQHAAASVTTVSVCIATCTLDCVCAWPAARPRQRRRYCRIELQSLRSVLSPSLMCLPFTGTPKFEGVAHGRERSVSDLASGGGQLWQVLREIPNPVSLAITAASPRIAPLSRGEVFSAAASTEVSPSLAADEQPEVSPVSLDATQAASTGTAPTSSPEEPPRTTVAHSIDE